MVPMQLQKGFAPIELWLLDYKVTWETLKRSRTILSGPPGCVKSSMTCPTCFKVMYVDTDYGHPIRAFSQEYPKLLCLSRQIGCVKSSMTCPTCFKVMYIVLDYGHPMRAFFQISQIFWSIGQIDGISCEVF